MATLEITKNNFDQIIAENAIVILDFWASWCGPCKAFGPVFEAASQLHPDIVFGKVNTEKEEELAGMFGIRSIPTLAVFREQIGIYMQPGALPPRSLEELITKIKEVNMDDVRKELESDPQSQQ